MHETYAGKTKNGWNKMLTVYIYNDSSMESQARVTVVWCANQSSQTHYL